jgi:hypothetical protein
MLDFLLGAAVTAIVFGVPAVALMLWVERNEYATQRARFKARKAREANSVSRPSIATQVADEFAEYVGVSFERCLEEASVLDLQDQQAKEDGMHEAWMDFMIDAEWGNWKLIYADQMATIHHN